MSHLLRVHCCWQARNALGWQRESRRCMRDQQSRCKQVGARSLKRLANASLSALGPVMNIWPPNCTRPVMTSRTPQWSSISTKWTKVCTPPLRQQLHRGVCWLRSAHACWRSVPSGVLARTHISSRLNTPRWLATPWATGLHWHLNKQCCWRPTRRKHARLPATSWLLIFVCRTMPTICDDLATPTTTSATSSDHRVIAWWMPSLRGARWIK